MRASGHRGWALRKRPDDLPVLVLSEGPECLRPNEPHRRIPEGKLGHGGVVGGFRDGDSIVLTRHQIERLQLGARFAKSLLCGVEPLRAVLDRFHALLSEPEQGNVCRHVSLLLLHGPLRAPYDAACVSATLMTTRAPDPPAPAATAGS